ncbi:MAG: hypothetical protein AAGH72_09360 [Verrucomicrobiota bacterium]
MKWLRRIGITFGAIILLFFLSLGFSTYSYSWTCIKCYDRYQVVERQFLGITLWKSKNRYSGHKDIYPSLYKEITGKACNPSFKTGGFGKSFGGLLGGGHGDGMTAEGMVFSERKATVKSILDLYQAFRNRELAIQSLEYVDQLIPSDLEVTEFYQNPEIYSGNKVKLYYYGHALKLVEREEEWRELNLETQQDIETFTLLGKEAVSSKLKSKDWEIRRQAKYWVDVYKRQASAGE